MFKLNKLLACDPGSILVQDFDRNILHRFFLFRLFNAFWTKLWYIIPTPKTLISNLLIFYGKRYKHFLTIIFKKWLILNKKYLKKSPKTVVLNYFVFLFFYWVIENTLKLKFFCFFIIKFRDCKEGFDFSLSIFSSFFPLIFVRHFVLQVKCSITEK